MTGQADAVQALRTQAESVTRAAHYFGAVAPPTPLWVSALDALARADEEIRCAIDAMTKS